MSKRKSEAGSASNNREGSKEGNREGNREGSKEGNKRVTVSPTILYYHPNPNSSSNPNPNPNLNRYVVLSDELTKRDRHLIKTVVLSNSIESVRQMIQETPHLNRDFLECMAKYAAKGNNLAIFFIVQSTAAKLKIKLFEGSSVRSALIIAAVYESRAIFWHCLDEDQVIALSKKTVHLIGWTIYGMKETVPSTEGYKYQSINLISYLLDNNFLNRPGEMEELAVHLSRKGSFHFLEKVVSQHREVTLRMIYAALRSNCLSTLSVLYSKVRRPHISDEMVIIQAIKLLRSGMLAYLLRHDFPVTTTISQKVIDISSEIIYREGVDIATVNRRSQLLHECLISLREHNFKRAILEFKGNHEDSTASEVILKAIPGVTQEAIPQAIPGVTNLPL